MKKKLLLLGIISLLIITSNILFAGNNYKITYYPFNQKNTTSEFSFLSKALPRSISTVLSREGFSEIDKGETSISDIKNRETILNIGNQLNTDLIVVGNYSIVGQGTSSKVQLVIFVYDIKGKERVIEKLVIGGTGTGIFVLIDETASIIEKAVKKYYKKRAQIIEAARKRRLKLEQLAEEERKRKEQARLELNKIKTKYNNSLYLDSHVASAAQLKLFYYTMFEYAKYDTEIPIVATSKTDKNLLINNLSASFGLGRNIELGIEQGIIFINKQSTKKFLSPTEEKSDNNKLFNPILFVKWRFLQNENHGLNTTFKFGLQMGLSKEYFSGSIFAPLYFTSAHSFHFQFALDKTWGNFTPFLNVQLIVARRYKGIDNNNLRISETEINELGDFSKMHTISFIISLGFEYRPLKWLILQPGILFSMVNGSYSEEIDTTSNISTVIDIDKIYYISPNIKVIFEIKKDLAISLALSYAFIPKFKAGETKTNIITHLPTSSVKQDISFKTVFRAYLYVAWAVDL